MNWNNVPTTCTAMQLTGFNLSTLLSSKNELEKLKYALQLVDNLIKMGYYQDFALLFAIVTESQMKNNLEWFFKNIGFQETFIGKKDKDKDSPQRHKETGDLHMWTTSPAIYKESLEVFKKDLNDRINVLDRRRICPERQKLEDLKLFHLKKADLVFKNSRVDNPIYQILENGVTAEAVAFFIRKNFGINVEETFGKNWTQVSTRQIKEAQVRWKSELVPY